jgi:hypothetical protein
VIADEQEITANLRADARVSRESGRPRSPSRLDYAPLRTGGARSAKPPELTLAATISRGEDRGREEAYPQSYIRIGAVHKEQLSAPQSAALLVLAS